MKRVLLLIPILIGVSLFIFVSMNLAKGDYVDTLNTEDLTEEQIHELRVQYGLDKGIFGQYVDYMWKLLHGDMGTSYISHQSVFKTFGQRIGATVYLAVASTIVTVIISIPLGIYAANHHGGIGDNIANVFGVIGLATPNFWLGLLLIVLFSLKLGWLPSGGNEGWQSVLLPAFTVGTGHTAMLMRTTRSAMLDTLSADYLRTARSKGVPEKTVIRKHALKNAMIPILNVAVGQFAGCFGGAALTETVFSWPGVGKMVVDSVKERDIPLVTGFLILKCTIISVIGLCNDLLYVAVDPRVKTMYVTTKKKGGKKNG